MGDDEKQDTKDKRIFKEERREFHKSDPEQRIRSQTKWEAGI